MAKGKIAALGYVGLEVSSLPAWKSFAGDLLGLHYAPRDDGTVDLRMDQYATRLRLHKGPRDDLVYVGWEVADAAALARLAARLTDHGIDSVEGTLGLAADRRVEALIAFSDPEGNRHEAFYGPLQRTDAPFISPTATRFKTGAQGLGHIVLSCRDKPGMMAFFTDILGFRISDHIRTEVIPGRPLEISFMRCNGRHHSLALAPVPIPKRIVHLMFEATTIDDVGRALQRCQQQGVHLSFTLGRHSNDEMLSFYPMSPSGFDIEYGWGGIEVDDQSWHVLTHHSNSAWGHQYQRPPRPSSVEATS